MQNFVFKDKVRNKHFTFNLMVEQTQFFEVNCSKIAG